jgi:hypothetical protein
VRVAGDPQARGGDAAGFEAVDLGDEQPRVDYAARADDADRAGIEDARGDVVEGKGLAVAQDRVPRVRAALIAAYEVRVLGEEVDDLPLALVAPLGADDDGGRHYLAWGNPWFPHGPPPRARSRSFGR